MYLLTTIIIYYYFNTQKKTDNMFLVMCSVKLKHCENNNIVSMAIRSDKCKPWNSTVVLGPNWAQIDNILKSFKLTSQCFYVVLMAYICHKKQFWGIFNF